MTDQTQTFTLGELLSYTTDVVVCDDMYRLAEHMAGQRIPTLIHLGAVVDDIVASIREQHPELADVSNPPPPPDGFDARSFYSGWLAALTPRFGDSFTLEPLPDPPDLSNPAHAYALAAEASAARS